MQRMHHYIAWLERKVAGHMDLSDLVGKSPVFRQALTLASEAAASRKPVWIVGEAGTGKEMFARAIHGSSDRAGKPYSTVNCAMTPTHLMESVLFGQDNGAVDQTHFSLSKLREAEQGTLLLEEIHALPPLLQRQLVDVLEKGALLGNSIDIRLIATTSTTSDSGVPEGIDPKLHQYLKPLVITLPPLHQRREDTILLAEHFLAMYATSENKYIRGLTERAKQWLIDHTWPGNVHQLGNVLWRAVVLCEGEMLDIVDLQLVLKNKIPALMKETSFSGMLDEKGKMKTLRSVQEEAIRFALQHAGGCMTRAARNLGIGRSTLYRKVSQLDLDPYISRANQTTRPMISVSSLERS
jgi:DNA-binding NtrC family response regulator